MVHYLNNIILEMCNTCLIKKRGHIYMSESNKHIIDKILAQLFNVGL